MRGGGALAASRPRKAQFLTEARRRLPGLTHEEVGALDLRLGGVVRDVEDAVVVRGAGADIVPGASVRVLALVGRRRRGGVDGSPRNRAARQGPVNPRGNAPCGGAHCHPRQGRACAQRQRCSRQRPMEGQISLPTLPELMARVPETPFTPPVHRPRPPPRRPAAHCDGRWQSECPPSGLRGSRKDFAGAAHSV